METLKLGVENRKHRKNSKILEKANTAGLLIPHTRKALGRINISDRINMKISIVAVTV